MSVPFSAEEFFGVFVAYNTGVWPAQILLQGAALAVVALSLRGPAWRHRAVLLTLGLLWTWMAIAYHWTYFSAINPAAHAFGAAFLVEGVVLVSLAVRADSPRFVPNRSLAGVAGAVLVAYALVLYPAIGWTLGHRYPSQPTFGLPCPTTIFTIGILLWAAPRTPRVALVIPALWSVVATSAVVSFGVFEDAMLPIAALLGWVLALRTHGVAAAPE